MGEGARFDLILNAVVESQPERALPGLDEHEGVGLTSIRA